MKVLQPPGWPRPKGYSNGISAKGRMIFTGGIVGWDERESFPSYRLHEQFAQRTVVEGDFAQNVEDLSPERVAFFAELF